MGPPLEDGCRRPVLIRNLLVEENLHSPTLQLAQGFGLVLRIAMGKECRSCANQRKLRASRRSFPKVPEKLDAHGAATRYQNVLRLSDCLRRGLHLVDPLLVCDAGLRHHQGKREAGGHDTSIKGHCLTTRKLDEAIGHLFHNPKLVSDPWQLPSAGVGRNELVELLWVCQGVGACEAPLLKVAGRDYCQRQFGTLVLLEKFGRHLACQATADNHNLVHAARQCRSQSAPTQKGRARGPQSQNGDES
mmetsp:Transcript_39578/g.114219  ORF Transcript_39578/g.114219 Transcript_39578/m.114219 type:complete len:247 (+) Transcript_39578:623-1363(+)